MNSNPSLVFVAWTDDDMRAYWARIPAGNVELLNKPVREVEDCGHCLEDQDLWMRRKRSVTAWLNSNEPLNGPLSHADRSGHP